MRVTIDIRPLMEANRSGVGTYAAEMLRALAARAEGAARVTDATHGVNQYVLFGNGRRAAFPADLPPASATMQRRFSHYPNRLLNAAFGFLDAPAVERIAGPSDAVWLPNLNFIATRQPLAVTVHDLSFIHFPGHFSAKQRLWHRAVNVPRLLRRAAAVVAVSEHTKRDVVSTFGIAPDRIAVATPAAGPEYRPQTEEAVAATRRRLGLTRPYFLSLGTLEPRKNVTGIIRAFDRVDADADLVIAGGRGWLYRDIFAAAARARKRDRIRFLGYVPATDKPALYGGALALVYPSFYEGFGMPPLEAMACGTPVIASHVSSLGEVVADAGILVNPSSVTDIARAMSLLLESPTLANALKDAGPRRASAFSWEKSAAVMEQVFARMARTGSDPAGNAS